MTTKPTLDDLRQEYRDMHEFTPEELDRRWARVKARHLSPPERPWLTRRDRVQFIVWCIFLATCLAIVFALTPGCSFPEEGVALGDPDHYRPPHPDGVHLPQHDADATSTPPDSDDSDGSEESGSTAEPSSEAESSSTPPDSDSSSESPPGESSDTGQDTGEPEPYEPAHCDMSCPAGDALEPTEAQSNNPDAGCYCGAPCEDDADCGTLEHCEPLFGQCTIACTMGGDCYRSGMTANDPEAVVACELWWNDAEHYTHFCVYAYEDAP